MLHLKVLDKGLNEVVEVVVEASHLVFHVFLERDAPDFHLVDQTFENCRPIMFLITKKFFYRNKLTLHA